MSMHTRDALAVSEGTHEPRTGWRDRRLRGVRAPSSRRRTPRRPVDPVLTQELT